MPTNSKINSFVRHYFERYKAIGQELDTEDKKKKTTKKIRDFLISYFNTWTYLFPIFH